jgi:hypothetical protein
MNEWKDEAGVDVAPSMIQILFNELKENGYTDEQVFALSEGLMLLAKSRISPNGFASRHRTSTLAYEGDLLLEGL